MRSFLLLTALVISFASFSQKQKVDVDDDIITVDGVPYAKITKSGRPAQDFVISSLDGTELVYMQFQEYNHSSKVTTGNPNGRQTYLICTFMNDKKQCEINPMLTKKGVAKFIVDYDLVKDNAVVQEQEDKMVLIYGSKFTEERNRLGGTTIIINNNGR
jgi:hypothetical protein